jgi:hypothetical protein
MAGRASCVSRTLTCVKISAVLAIDWADKSVDLAINVGVLVVGFVLGLLVERRNGLKAQADAKSKFNDELHQAVRAVLDASEATRASRMLDLKKFFDSQHRFWKVNVGCVEFSKKWFTQDLVRHYQDLVGRPIWDRNIPWFDLRLDLKAIDPYSPDIALPEGIVQSS